MYKFDYLINNNSIITINGKVTKKISERLTGPFSTGYNSLCRRLYWYEFLVANPELGDFDQNFWISIAKGSANGLN